MKRKQERAPPNRRWAASQGPRNKVVRVVQLPETIVVSELANRMAEARGRRGQGADEQWHDGHAEPDHRRRYCRTDHTRNFGHRVQRARIPMSKTSSTPSTTSPKTSSPASARHHDHGPRRPSASTSLLDKISGRRMSSRAGLAGSRSISASLPGEKTASGAVLSSPRHARPRGLHARMRAPWRAGDGYRRAGRRRRRCGDAA